MEQVHSPKTILNYLHQQVARDMTFDDFVYRIRKEILKRLGYLVSAVDYREVIYKAVDAKIFKEEILWMMEE